MKSDKPKSYKFSPTIRKELKAQGCFERNNWQGIKQVLVDWMIIFVSIFGTVWAHQSHGFLVSIPMYFAAIVVIGVRQRALAELLHQAAHKTLAANKKLNYFLGTALSGWTVFQSFSVYHRSHVLNHHRWIGTDKDPDYQSLRNAGIYGQNLGVKEFRRYLYSLLSPRTTAKYLADLFRDRIFAKEEEKTEKYLRLSFLTITVTLIYSLGYTLEYILFWLIPMLTTAAWYGSLCELSEHYPRLETQALVDIYLSRNRAGLLSGIHQDEYHAVHHILPGVVAWKQKQAHKIMLQDPEYAKIHGTTPKGWFALIKEIEQELRQASLCK